MSDIFVFRGDAFRASEVSAIVKGMFNGKPSVDIFLKDNEAPIGIAFETSDEADAARSLAINVWIAAEQQSEMQKIQNGLFNNTPRQFPNDTGYPDYYPAFNSCQSEHNIQQPK